jgi:DUF1009 family protein
VSPNTETVRHLGILAGAGALPREVAEARRAAGLPVFVIDLEGAAADWVGVFPHKRVSLGQVGRVLTLLKEQDCDAITMAGGLVRPSLARIRFDRKGLAYLPRVARLFRRGDDGLLAGIAGLFEEEGFRIVGAETFLPAALARPGAMAGTSPDMTEIYHGRAVLDALAPFDIGQAVVVEQGHCIAVEAAEGTAAMLDRVAILRQGRDRGGILVKMPKRGQDARLDRPAIGPETVRGAVNAGLAAIAVEAGGVLILDATETERLARDAGISLFGFDR